VPKQPLIVGNPVFVVVDMQEGGGLPADEMGIPVMPGNAERVAVAERLLAAARAADIVLRGLKADTLILVGGLTDVCVHYTFADAHQRDYYVRVVTDCVGGSSQYRHDAALDAMEYLQTGALRTSDEILAAFHALAEAADPALEDATR
jgi:nicotinamidase-related amidase